MVTNNWRQEEMDADEWADHEAWTGARRELIAESMD
jgi:hypothetical protein